MTLTEDTENTLREVTLGPLRFNPVVSFFAMVLIWGIAIYCMADEKDASETLGKTMEFVADEFTWLYIGSQDIWIIFCVYLYFSKWGNKKLCAMGDEDEAPEFSNSSYFMMLFTCGVAVGMFFFGVTEPVYYYTYASRYTNEPNSDSQKAQWAITLTVFHWGLHGWIPYCLVALAVGFSAYRHNRPLTMRSTLYPLLGDRMDGWIGDTVDFLSIFTIIAGVCTSLALGTRQIASGLYRLDQDLFDINDADERKDAWTVIIVCITAVACLSVVSGIHNGIKTIAITAFGLAVFLQLMVFFMDDTVFFLDVMVQSVGHYLQYIVELGWVTDAFQRQFTHGTHNANPRYSMPGAPPDMYEDGFAPTSGGDPRLMEYWTIFYWGWWIAWSPFVGMFIARISKGRTIREVFNYCMVAPLIYVIIWFSIFGGAGIKMHNSALECENQLPVDGACQVVTGPLGRQGYAIYDTNGANTNGSSLLFQEDEVVPAEFSRDDNRRIVYTFSYSSDYNFFELLEQYYGWGDFLSGVTIATIILYFVTSSDSGSLVVDIISANGHKDSDPHWVQRVLWSITEGALAIGLMRAGGDDAQGASALRAISIAAGLPYTIILCLMCTSLYRMLQFDDGSKVQTQYRWKSMPIFGGVLDLFEIIFSFGGLLSTKALDFGKIVFHLKETFIGAVLPCYHVYKTLEIVNAPGTPGETKMINSSKLYNYVMTFFTFAAEVIFIVGHSINSEYGGWYAFAWVFYCLMVVLMAMVRSQTRCLHKIEGNIVEDFMACFFLYFNAGPQYYFEAQLTPPEHSSKGEDDGMEMQATTKKEAVTQV
jgi:choline-glycine betaine transporter